MFRMNTTTAIQVAGIFFIYYSRAEIVKNFDKMYRCFFNKPMPKYSVPNKHLKEYTTTKSDKKKNRFRIPPDMYKVKDEEIPPPQTSPQSKEQGTPLEYIMSDADFSEESRSRTQTIYQRNATEKVATLPDFKVIKRIGKGSFGTIYLVEKKDSKLLYAMKQLRKDIIIKTDALICTKLEKEVLKMAHHPFLVGLDYVFQTPTSIYFVMKYFKGGELYKHLLVKKRFPESIVKFYGAQIALALGELHKNKIIYRDMKPENILMDVDGYIALADFGLAKLVEEDKPAMTFCGTPEYIAPETIKGMGYNKPIDWWGLGILLYELIIGMPPFHSNNQHVLFQYINSKDVIFPDMKKYGIAVSEKATDIIKKLLEKKPSMRLGSENDVEEVLKHPFFADVDIGKLLAKEITPEYVPKIMDEASPTDEKKDIEVIDPKSLKFIKKNEVNL